MDPSTSSVPDGSIEKFLHIPYNQRWEYLKDTIINIYTMMGKSMQLVEKEMREKYSFYASEKQYKYHLGKWGIKKNTTARQKDAAIAAIAKRRLPPAASTPNVVITEGDFAKVMENKKIKRYARESIRKREQLTWTPGLFLQYDLPFAALFPRRNGSDIPSPSIAGPATPDNMIVGSPQEGASPPMSHNSMSHIIRKSFFDRAMLFLGDRKQDLLEQLNRDEKRHTATWLHDFWMFSFMTAKYWGRGPKAWDLEMINFKSLAGYPVPLVPGQRIHLNDMSSSPSSVESSSQPEAPTQLCRWSIHYADDTRYEIVSSPPLQPLDESGERFDINDESTWTQWDIDEDEDNDLATAIQKGLRRNEFSAIKPESLPLDASLIVHSVERSQDIEAEAFCFAIISRNLDVISSMLRGNKLSGCSSASSPFHLAASFIDGAKSCCLIMHLLTKKLEESMSIGAKYIDNSGLTVLDTLLITIIRSHSTVSPQSLGNAFTGRTRYQGEDVDPCGRWDADSPCIRHLYASGKSTIPPEWKHIFCHTSVQTICHCITVVFTVDWRPDINTPSGLFLRRCTCCGLELKIGPIHALVLTAFCLANNGMPEESLFGMVACLVCLLTFRADPCATAKVSTSMILGSDSEDHCQHKDMNPVELASTLFDANGEAWTDSIRLGWKVLIAILQHDITKRQGNQDESECSHLYHFEPSKDRLIYCGNQRLGIIWAMIQAELLTYRRLTEEDPWLPPRFDMQSLLEGLENNDDDYLKRLADGGEGPDESLLRGYSCCGFFYGAGHPCARREEACTSYYANLDDWKRTAFIEPLVWE